VAVPQLQIGDFITVANNDLATTQATPIGVLAPFVTQELSLPQYTDFTVVGITVNSSKDNYLQQQLELEVKILAHYFTIGVSAIGSVIDAISPG
jgi:saccharopine dehydrogenase-like NADP-dependent oxidoreductase